VFDYTDSEGGETKERRLTAARLQVETFGGTFRPGLLYVTGWCHIRREVRTFREDGIANLHDAETGEVIADHRSWLLARVRGQNAG
jgi:predicted DNA-binding transcriptional regulator YafY